MSRFRLANSHLAILLRIFIIGFGCIAVIWGLAVLPIFWRVYPIEHAAKHITAGEAYKIQTLTEQVPIVESTENAEYCYPAAVRGAAIIRLRIMETTIPIGERKKDDDRIKSVAKSIRNSLSCSPADPFLWLALYSMESGRDDFNESQRQYLRLAYRLGPNEGWVGLKRSGIVLSNFERLPPDLKEDALTEFVNLLNSGFIHETVTVFTGVAWSVQVSILPKLKNVAATPRQAFADALYRQNVNVVVPGTIRQVAKPWH